MAELTIYLEPDVEALVLQQAQQAGQSASTWIGDAIRLRARRQWAPEVLALTGTWGDDFPDAEELRKGYGQDVPRETL